MVWMSLFSSVTKHDATVKSNGNNAVDEDSFMMIAQMSSNNEWINVVDADVDVNVDQVL